MIGLKRKISIFLFGGKEKCAGGILLRTRVRLESEELSVYTVIELNEVSITIGGGGGGGGKKDNSPLTKLAKGLAKRRTPPPFPIYPLAKKGGGKSLEKPSLIRSAPG